MNDPKLDKLNEDIHYLIRDLTVEYMMEQKKASVGDTVETMLKMSHVVAMNYASSLCATIGALAQMRKEDGDRRITPELLRGLIDEELDHIVSYTREKLAEVLEENGAREVLDPNHRLRAEILETINAKL